MASVQFYGIDNVVRELQEADPSFVKLYQGKQFLYGAVTDEVIEMITRMAEGGTDAVYTVKFYDDQERECGSFNFKLTQPGAGIYGVGRYGNMPPNLESRLAGIEKKLNEDKEDKGNGLIGKITDYIENNPFAQRIIMGLAGKYLNIPGLDANTPMEEAATHLAGVAEDDDRRISAAVERLKARAPGKVGEYLSKFAAMDDATFKQICAALDTM